MALALLKYDVNSGNNQQFSGDIGKNRYFRIIVGGAETFSRYGVPLIKDQKFASPMYGPILDSSFGRIHFEIPANLITHEYAYVQLYSYKDKDENGIAISSIVRVIPSSTNNHSMQNSVSFSVQTNPPVFIEKAMGSVAFQYKEKPVSNALFLDKLMEFLPKAIPMIGSLLGGKPKTDQKGGSKSGLQDQLLKLIQDPEQLQKVMDLLKGLLTPASSGQETKSESKSYARSTKWSGAMMDPMTIMTLISAVTDGLQKLGTIGAQINKDELDTIVKLNPGVVDADVQGLLNQMSVSSTSRAMMDPATITTLISSITDGLEKLGQIGADINKDELDTIIKLNPGVVDADVQGLLNQMGVKTYPFPSIKFKNSALARLEIQGLSALSYRNQSCFCFSYGRAMGFPLKINAPKEIPKGIVQLIVRRENGETLIQHRLEHNGSNQGILSIVPEIPAYLADDLIPGEMYKAYIAVIWRGKNGEKLGASIDLPILVTSGYFYDRIGSSKEPVPLNDINTYRAFWHKVWQSDFTEDVVRYEFECKYYFALEHGRTRNAQMETIELMSPARPRKMEGKMKSGLVMSPTVLNQLLPALGSFPMLTEQQLAAVEAEDFIVNQQKASRTGLEYKGKTGEMAALWVYPEVQATEVYLRKEGAVNQYGNVENTIEEVVFFPSIVSAHFIGVTSN
ncbi:hypothetical protein [Fluviicola taffensis]|uniref:hypothetical protein n=1 Tax=Fluviicola taffensis TaxID=191579 RepID=UPI003137A580